MTSKELIKAIIAGEQTERCGFWMGHPHKDTWPGLCNYLNQDTPDQVRNVLGDDIIWLSADRCYKHPEGKSAFNFREGTHSLGEAGYFADCESVTDVENFPWPNPDYLDFSEYIEELKQHQDKFVLSGLWSPFFHLAADAFGMENYFIKMFTNPDVVQAVTTHIVDYYLAANRRLFEQAGEYIDGFFFGNDFGSQLDLLVGPEQFEEFIFPYFGKLTELGHEFDLKVFLHSCGSIYKVIPKLIELGVDVLHPLQAKAVDMDAETLQEFNCQVVFMGGIDTQHLLVNGTPEEIKADVRRVRSLLGPQLIVSPSHEALLPDIPPANVEAMSEAAHEAL